VGLGVLEDDLSEFVDVIGDDLGGFTGQVEVSLTSGVGLLVGGFLNAFRLLRLGLLSALDLDGAGVIGDSVDVVCDDSLEVADVVLELSHVGVQISDDLHAYGTDFVPVVTAFLVNAGFDGLGVLDLIDNVLDHGDDLLDLLWVGLDLWKGEEFGNIGDD